VYETRFYFTTVGLLGMLDVLLPVWTPRLKPEYAALASAVLIGVLGLRSAVRGYDWRDKYTLAYNDAAASANYSAESIIAYDRVLQP
jgi:hypothetical protein